MTMTVCSTHKLVSSFFCLIIVFYDLDVVSGFINSHKGGVKYWSHSSNTINQEEVVSKVPGDTSRRLVRLSAIATTSTTKKVEKKENDNTDNVLEILQSSDVVDPVSGKSEPALPNSINSNNPLISLLSSATSQQNQQSKKTLVVLLPQLGDFDSAEYVEHLMAVLPDLTIANIKLRLIGIGDSQSAKQFARFNKIPMDILRVDPQATIHNKLNLHKGPNWDMPKFIPNFILSWFCNYVGAPNDPDKLGVLRAWVNYMAMCAGISAPDTLPEIFRGYIGDKSAPERIRDDEIVTVGNDDIVIKGVTDVKLGPIEYQSLWKNEQGYQRPAELATVRLRVMVEVLSNLSVYVHDQKYLDIRGGTFLFDDSDGTILYEHRDTGVLSYSKTMSRPLTFLRPYIGLKALNALELGDTSLIKALESSTTSSVPV